MWNLSSALLGEGKPLWGDDLELPNPHTPLITASQKPPQRGHKTLDQISTPRNAGGIQWL